MPVLDPAFTLSLALLLALAPSAATAVQTAPTDHAAHHRFVLPSFTFEDGTTLPHTVVSYGTYGRLNARRDNVILLPSSYMADHHDWAGWLTSQQWWHDELWNGPTWPPGDSYESVVGYFSDSLFAGFDANDLILQARTWQHHDVGATPGFQGNIERALGSIRARVLYLPVQTDLYFPVSDAHAEARYIRRVDLEPIPSLWGHVAGGGGDEGAKPFVNAKIAAFLRESAR